MKQLEMLLSDQLELPFYTRIADKFDIDSVTKKQFEVTSRPEGLKR